MQRTLHSDEAVNKFDRSLIDYVLLWTPFGGPPEDEVFPQFGFRRAQLERRFCRIMLRMVADENVLTESDRELLGAVRRAYPNTFDAVPVPSPAG